MYIKSLQLRCCGRKLLFVVVSPSLLSTIKNIYVIYYVLLVHSYNFLLIYCRIICVLIK